MNYLFSGIIQVHMYQICKNVYEIYRYDTGIKVPNI